MSYAAQRLRAVERRARERLRANRELKSLAKERRAEECRARERRAKKEGVKSLVYSLNWKMFLSIISNFILSPLPIIYVNANPSFLFMVSNFAYLC